MSATQATKSQPAWRDIFPGVSIDREQRLVRLQGSVPIDAHNPKAPRVFLEVLVCSRNTKEHEALVVTPALASHVHAALLMIGLEPGSPGLWTWDKENANEAPALRSTTPRGPRLRVGVRPEGSEHAQPIQSWVRRADADAGSLPEGEHFVFAGSMFRTIGPAGTTREAYAADSDGTIIGLTAFGSETIAWTRMYHHDTSVQSPVWIADVRTVPKFGTKVEVVIEVDE